MLVKFHTVSLESEHAMDVLRVATKCFPTDTYFTNNINEDFSLWHGQGMWMLKEMAYNLPDIQLVTDLSESNETLAVVQTLAENRADIANDNFGLTFAR